MWVTVKSENIKHVILEDQWYMLHLADLRNSTYHYRAAGSKLNCLYHVHIHLGEIGGRDFC